MKRGLFYPFVSVINSRCKFSRVFIRSFTQLVLITCMPATSCFRRLMYRSLYWRLIALECAHLKGLLVLCRMLSQDMSEVITYPPVSLNSQQPSNTHQTHHYATATSADCKKTQSWALCPLFVSHHALLSILSSRPSTGTQMWMKWKELSQIIKERSSTDSLESGMKPFSVETRHQPHASGEQVWLTFFFRWESFYSDVSLIKYLMHWVIFCVF